MATNLREVLEAIAKTPQGITKDNDAVALLSMHQGRVDECKPAQSLPELIAVRDEARKALASTAKVCETSVVARSHAETLRKAVTKLTHMLEKKEQDAVSLLDIHLGRVEQCNHTDDLLRLIAVRDGARKALTETFEVRKDSVVARSHAVPLEDALGPLDRLIDKLELEIREVPMGQRTGRKKGELEEGFNPRTKKYEFHHPEEWDNLAKRAPVLSGDVPTPELDDENFPPLPGSKSTKKPVRGSTKMETLSSGVRVQKGAWVGKAEMRLKIERESTSKMRKELTENLNSRTGEAQKGVVNNSKMATKLADLLKTNPEMLEPGGLLSRIVGDPTKTGIEGQGQHKIKQVTAFDEHSHPIPVIDKKTGEQAVDKDGNGIYQSKNDPKDVPRVIQGIIDAAARLAEGKGEGEDANVVLQFIGCFVDGLTEVNEGQKTAQKQFDKVWPALRDAMGLTDGDKKKLLERVNGYKEIAGAQSDTLSGKGKRKGDTRVGIMPNDPRLKIQDDDALIKGDLSGSMHSCLLAQELSESLFGGGGLKDVGDPVQIVDKGLLNARAVDALALTAGGKQGSNDMVFHTAYEMINGMRAITGLPYIDQVTATEIMRRMTEGMSFTDAVEESIDDVPWND